MRPARAVALLTVAVGGAVTVSSCGPHMRRQASLRPFEREMPPMPAGTVSREGPDPMPAAANAKAAQNPLTADAATLARGRLYYTYYCAMCHGEDGRGRTPVGEAYWPRPTDLTSAAVQRLSGGELYRAMLTGPGHDPVLLSTVARDRRWPIVLFLRTLGAGQAPEPNG